MSNAYLTKKFNNIYQGNSEKNNESIVDVINVYLGNNSDGTKNKELRKLKDREAKGAEIYGNASPDVKAALDQIKDVFSAYSEKQARLNDNKRSKTLGGQIEQWQGKYSPEVTSELNDLSMAYQGRDNNGRRSTKLRSLDKRYEQANGVVLNLINNGLSEEKKTAAKELSAIFNQYEEKKELKQIADTYARSNGKARYTNFRSPLRSENQRLVSTLDEIVSNSETPAQESYQVQPVKPSVNVSVLTQGSGKKSLMQYLHNAVKTPLGKIASLAAVALTVGMFTYAGCGKAGEDKLKDLNAKYKTEETIDRNKTTIPNFTTVRGQAEAQEITGEGEGTKINNLEKQISQLIKGEEGIPASKTAERIEGAKGPEYQADNTQSKVNANISDLEADISKLARDEAVTTYVLPEESKAKDSSVQYSTEPESKPKIEGKELKASPIVSTIDPQDDYTIGGEGGAVPSPKELPPEAQIDSRISKIEQELDYMMGGEGAVPSPKELPPEAQTNSRLSELEKQLDDCTKRGSTGPHLDYQKATPAPTKGSEYTTGEASTVKQCLSWTESDLEKGIREYKFNKNGKFKAKLNKDLTKVVKEEGGTVVARLLLPTKDGKNKVYETSIIGPKGEIEIDTGNNYQKNFQLGVSRISLGPNGEKCVEYHASIRRGVTTGIVTPTAVTPKLAQKEKLEIKIIKEFGKDEPRKEEEAKKTPKEEDKTTKDLTIQPEQTVAEILPVIPLNITTVDMFNKKAWGFSGNFGYVTSERVEKGQNMYGVVVDLLKEQNPDYVFFRETIKTKSVNAAVPNLTVEFSKNPEERLFREVTDEKDANTLEKVILMNFNNDKRAKTSYEDKIKLDGEKTSHERAAQVTREITKRLAKMRKQGDFNTHWFDRDVKKANPSVEPSIQGHLFKNAGFENYAGMVFTAEGADVGTVEESHWGDIKVGKQIQNPVGGVGGGDGGAAGGSSGGGAGPGGPGGTI